MSLARRAVPPIGLVLGGVLIASAASLGLSSDTLGAGSTATPRCTSASLSILQNLSAGTVISVTVATLPATCGGGTLQVAVNNGIATGSGSAVIPAGGGAVTVTLGSAPARRVTDQVDLVVVGP